MRFVCRDQSRKKVTRSDFAYSKTRIMSNLSYCQTLLISVSTPLNIAHWIRMHLVECLVGSLDLRYLCSLLRETNGVASFVPLHSSQMAFADAVQILEDSRTSLMPSC